MSLDEIFTARSMVLWASGAQPVASIVSPMGQTSLSSLFSLQLSSVHPLAFFFPFSLLLIPIICGCVPGSESAPTSAPKKSQVLLRDGYHIYTFCIYCSVTRHVSNKPCISCMIVKSLAMCSSHVMPTLSSLNMANLCLGDIPGI